MPLHDWTRVPSGLFHHFHQSWSVEITKTLNAGRLPSGTMALVEQRSGPRELDVLAIESRANRPPSDVGSGGVAVKEPPVVQMVHKDTRVALREFVDKTVAFLREGIHVLIVDLFPPTPRDPQGIHSAIWDEIGSEPFVFPSGKDRTLVSYESGDDRIAYIVPIAVGDTLREMPVFLSAGLHVPVPLEPTYQVTWDASPEGYRLAVETGVLPEGDQD
jgi:hypothetical protein